MPKDRGIQLVDSFDGGEVMDIKINPVRDASGKIISGFVIGNTLEQNKALLLLSQPGELKSRPDIGVGLEDALMSEDYLYFRHRIREHFAKDGLSITKLDFYENKPIKIDAKYNS